MKVLKRRVVTAMLCMLCVAAFALAIVFTLPARTANAEEEFVPANTVTVSTEKALKEAVSAAGAMPTKIILDGDIEMNSISSVEGWEQYELVIGTQQNIQIDLAGHILTCLPNPSAYCVIQNWGKLSVIDSSGNYKGAVESHGYISNAKWRPTTAISNSGTLTVNASVRIVKPESSADPGDVRYYTTTTIVNARVINNTLYIPSSDEEDQNIYPVSLTINGGNFELFKITKSNGEDTGIDQLFGIQGADLTVNGGTFANHRNAPLSYSENPHYVGNYGFLAELTSLPKQTSEIEAKIKDDRQVDIKITGGDFVEMGPKNTSIVYIYSYQGPGGNNSKKIDGENFTITISGGDFACDFSAYAANGYWMEPVVESSTFTYYTVKKVNMDAVAATVTVGGTTTNYLSYESAWTAARKMFGDSRIVTLLKDDTVKNLDLNNVNGDMIIELNGHKLTIEPDSSVTYKKYFTPSSNSSYKNRVVIQDTSGQGGELILSDKNGHQSRKAFIMLDSNGNTHYELRSGTIRLTGMLDEQYHDMTSTKLKQAHNVISNNWELAMYQTLFGLDLSGVYNASAAKDFYESHREQYKNFVVIKGGNIISDLTCGTYGSQIGDLFYWQACSSLDPTEYDFDYTTPSSDYVPYKNEIFVVNLEEYLQDGIKACRFSWDFNELVSAKGLSCSGGNGRYIVSKIDESENFLVNSTAQKYNKLSDALSHAAEKDTISVLQDNLTVEDSTTLNGIALDLNVSLSLQINFAQGITLGDGASIANGTVFGNVTVNGDSSLSNMTLNGNVNIESGMLAIDSGTYNGTFIVEDGSMKVSGGSFLGSQAEVLESYLGFALGLYKKEIGDYDKDTLYDVKIAPNLAAQKWYTGCSEAGNFTIGSEAEWNYFSTYVNSGIDQFANKTVSLTAPLDFNGSQEGISLFAARETAKPFLPAGNLTYPFLGSFDGNRHEIKGIVAREKLVGLFGYTKGTTKVSNVTVIGSTFTVGNGYLDELNAGAGYLAGGAIIGEGYNGTVQNNIVLNDVTVDFDINGYSIFSGAIIGHTWGGVTVEDLNMTGSSVSSNWKAGGLVGYYEGNFTLTDSDISEVDVETFDSFFAPGVVAGHANGSKTSLENCKVEAPDQSLIGTSYSGNSKNVVITGSKTDIHVQSLGTNSMGSVEIELSTDEDGNSSQVQFSVGASGLPSNLTVTQNGDSVDLTGDLKTDPENGSFIFEADPKDVDLYKGNADESVHVGSYATIQEAIDAALSGEIDGDRIYLQNDANGDVKFNGNEKSITINLLGHTLTGTITVESGTLMLENGTVNGSITVSGGTLTLVIPKLGEDETEIKELKITATSGKAIDGEYTVEKNGNDVCVRESDNEIYLAKDHDFTTYTAEGAVITVSCKHDGEVAGTITLKAENFTYDGNAHPATVAVDPEGLVDTPAITYRYSTTANGTYTELEGDLPMKSGYYEASITVNGVTVSVKFASLQMGVIVSDITVGEVVYGDQTLAATSFTVKTTDGEVLRAEDFTLTVTLKKSDYGVGDQVALITALSLGGDAAANYTLAAAGQQAFLEITVTPATLYVSVNSQGEVTYDGFVNGEDESVLSGELVLERKGNVVTPSGLESENYNIVFVSGTVGDTADLTALWIALATVGAAAIVAAGLFIGLRKKKQ